MKQSNSLGMGLCFCSFFFWIHDYIDRSKRFIRGKEVRIWIGVQFWKF